MPGQVCQTFQRARGQAQGPQGGQPQPVQGVQPDLGSKEAQLHLRQLWEGHAAVFLRPSQSAPVPVRFGSQRHNEAPRIFMKRSCQIFFANLRVLLQDRGRVGLEELLQVVL